MAYKNLVSQSCADKKEWFCRMRDFICKRNGTYDYSTTGIGWTLFDSNYAVDENNPAIADWFVIYSPGEDGKQDLYFQVAWLSGGIRIQGYLTWNPATNAGGVLYGPSVAVLNITLAETGVYVLWLYGDLNNFTAINRPLVGDYRGNTFGILTPVYDHQTGEVVICSSALSAGSDVSITVDTVPSNWKVGRNLFIRTTHTDNTATAKIEKTIIKTLIGTTITCDLVNSYTANSKLTDSCYYVCPTNANYASSNSALITNAGTTNIAVSPTADISIVIANRDPDPLESSFGVSVFNFSGATGVSGRYSDIYSISSVGLTLEDVFEGEDGFYYRFFKLYSTIYVVIKEV